MPKSLSLIWNRKIKPIEEEKRKKGAWGSKRDTCDVAFTCSSVLTSIMMYGT